MEEIAIIVSTIKLLIGILRNFLLKTPVMETRSHLTQIQFLACIFLGRNNTCDYNVCRGCSRKRMFEKEKKDEKCM